VSLEYERNAFLDALYASAVSGGSWKLALAAYTKLIGAHAGALQVHDIKKRSVGANAWVEYSDEFIERGRARFADDPWVELGRAKIALDPRLLRSGFVFRASSEMRFTEFRRSTYYGEYAKEVELADSLACAVFKDDRYGLTISAHNLGRSERAFTQDQQRLVNSVFSDFQRALNLHVQLARERTFEASASLWSATRLPVFLTKDRRVLLANHAGQSALSGGEIVRTIGDRISFRDPTLTEAASVLEGSPERRQIALATIGSTGLRWLVQMVRFNQLSGSLLGDEGLDSPALLIVLTPIDLDAGKRSSAVNALQGLTKMERCIALDLANGGNVSAIAETRVVSVATVRWHVRNLIEKMGARSLADLQRILALLLPFG
jgi:DNA-binding CsgD family transcriptional regulator